MGKEVTLLGIAGIIIGIAIYIKTQNLWAALVPTIIGLGLIIFYKEEDKIEKRRDEK